MKLQHLFTFDFSPGKIYTIESCPYSVLWDICYSCNQKCRFCYNSITNFRRPIPNHEITLQLAGTLCDWGIKEIIYLGGEPTIHPHLVDVIEVVGKNGLNQRLITNGAFVTQEIIDTFIRYGVEAGVSLHGTNSNVHDSITQTPGSFEKAQKAIAILNENNNAKWYIQFTPTNEGESLYLSVLKLKCQFKNLYAIDINRLMPQGVGKDYAGSFQNQQSWWNCLADIPRIKKIGVKVSVESVPHCWIREKGRQYGLSSFEIESILESIRPCYMGINQIAMDDIGRLKLCPGGNGFSQSILETSPEDLWLNDALLIKRRRFDFLPQCCIDFSNKTACDSFYQCGGGCKMSVNDSSAQNTICDYLISETAHSS